MSESVLTVESEKVPDALAVGLLGIDASRRVGWAKAFAALGRVDSLEEEIRQTRDELKWLRRAYSRLLGFVVQLPNDPTKVLKRELATHLRAERTFRHDDAWMAGGAAAWDHRACLYGWSEEELAIQRKNHEEGRKEEKAVSWERKQRKADKATEKWRLRELHAEAVALGHDTEKGPTVACFACGGTTNEREAVCSCGVSSGVLSEEDTVAWCRNHWSQIVHGMSFAEWSQGSDQ